MDYQHFHCVSLKYIQNNLEYLILLSMILISDTPIYGPSGNSNSSLHVGADILNLLLLYELFTFFHV